MTQDRNAPSAPAPATPFPWIGALLAAACVLVSVWAQVERYGVEEGRGELYAAARSYFLEHPYLEPGPALAALVGVGERIVALQAHEADRLESGSGPVAARLHDQRQHKLDAMLADAEAKLGTLPAARFGVVPADGLSPRWLGYALLHDSRWQLLGNVLLLLFFAVYLESTLGRAVFALTAAGAALGGAAVFAWGLPGHDRTALVGSTPLLAGLWVAFALRHWGARNQGFYGVGLVLGATWLLLPPWARLRWSLAEANVLVSTPLAPILWSYWSCLGAAAAGAIAPWIGLRRDALASGTSAATPAVHPLFKRALRSRDAGRPREALEDLAEYLRIEPDSHAAALLAWELAESLGRAAEATAALIRVTEIELERGLVGAALEHWQTLVCDGIPLEASPRFLVAVSLALRERGERHEAAGALRCALERSDDSASRSLAARIARAARGLDPEIVEVAAWRALGSIELGLNERRALENLIAEVLPATGARLRASGLESEPSAAVEEPQASPPPPGVAERRSRARQAPIELDRERVLKAIPAVPVRLGDVGLEVQTRGGQARRVDWSRIDAVALAAVEGLGPKHVMLLDLALDWSDDSADDLHVIRLRGDRYDPRRLVGAHDSTVDALREMMEVILERSEATPLPDAASVVGRPFASFPDLETYERAVFSARSEGESRGERDEEPQGRSE